MAGNDSISVIAPVFNEQENIYAFIMAVFSGMAQLKAEGEIIIVNNGSTDGTSRILAATREELSRQSRGRLKVVYEAKRGYGYALRRGIEEAEGEWVVLMDGDNQFRISSLSQFWSLREEFNLILGYRAPRRDSLYRRFLGKTGNFCANLWIKSKGYPYIKDINCGFKVCRAGLIKPLSLRSTGGLIYFEMLYKLASDKVKICQLPVEHFPRNKGSSTGGRISTIIILLKEALSLLCSR